MRRRFFNINDTSNKYLTIVALEDGLTASLSRNACEYCIDGDGNWTSLAANTATPSINAGQTLSFRGELTPTHYGGIGSFKISKRCNLEGDCSSILFSNIITRYCFYYLFGGCTTIVNVSPNFLPATTLADYCYHYMFRGCTNLTTAPELPATTLATSCYNNMFEGCTSLTTAPSILPATTLARTCYYYMFSGCTSLITAPELPATTLADYCYNGMFYDCRSLTTAPALPATTLADSCYNNMFYYCLGLAAAPELPATTLARSCYYHMFYHCARLQYIKMLATDISATDCLNDWVFFVSSSGTFVKHPDMTSLPTGESGIPEGWTVQNNDDSDVGGGTGGEEDITLGWTVQSGTWNEYSDSNAADGKSFTCVSPGHSRSTVIRCTFSGVTSITFNCVYDGENNWDYLTIGELDTECTRDSYGTTLQGMSGEERSITFECDGGEHFVEFCYSKDGNANDGADNATVYVKSYQ